MKHAFANRPRASERTWWLYVIIPAVVLIWLLQVTDRDGTKTLHEDRAETTSIREGAR